MRILPRLPLLFLAAPLLACSGAVTSVDPSPDAQAADDASPPTADGSAPDASPPAPDGGDAGKRDLRIDPIEMGYTWTYDVKILGTYPLCSAGTQTGKVVGTMTSQGKTGFRIQSLCPAAGVSDYAVSGDKVEVRVAELGPWELALDVPVAEGHKWSNAYGSFVWHAIPAETVGGKLVTEECWQAKDQNGPSYTNYCRGTGPTRWHIEDKLGNGYDAVLTGTSF
jgi:hypothetical protein